VEEDGIKTTTSPQICCHTTLWKVSGQLYSFTAQLIQLKVVKTVNSGTQGMLYIALFFLLRLIDIMCLKCPSSTLLLYEHNVCGDRPRTDRFCLAGACCGPHASNTRPAWDIRWRYTIEWRHCRSLSAVWQHWSEPRSSTLNSIIIIIIIIIINIVSK